MCVRRQDRHRARSGRSRQLRPPGSRITRSAPCPHRASRPRPAGRACQLPGGQVTGRGESIRTQARAASLSGHRPRRPAMGGPARGSSCCMPGPAPPGTPDRRNQLEPTPRPRPASTDPGPRRPWSRRRRPPIPGSRTPGTRDVRTQNGTGPLPRGHPQWRGTAQREDAGSAAGMGAMECLGPDRPCWGAVPVRQSCGGAVSIGETLAQSRQRAGLSVARVSEQTRIRETIIRSVEDDDYSACGGDFYARGTSAPSPRRWEPIPGR